MELKHLLGEPPHIVLDQNASAMDAIAAMVENDISSIIVDREDSEDAFGIVTTKDIIGYVIAKGLDPNDVKIVDICSKPLISLNNVELDIRWVAKKMSDEDVSRLAVFDGEDLRCIVSDVDVLKAIEDKLKKKGSDEPSEKGEKRGDGE